MQTEISDNRLYDTRKIELHRKGKKSGDMAKAPTTVKSSWENLCLEVREPHTFYVYIS